MVQHIPPGQPSVTANLVVRDGLAMLDFYRRAFDAEILLRLVADDVLMYSEVRIAGTVVTVSDEMPEFGVVAPDPQGAVHASFTLWVPDADATFARAVAAGATPVSEPADQFHGDRTGVLRDPSGHRWLIATHLEDMTEAEMAARMAQVMGQ
ncbi:VOC family protein [Actinotalea sp. JY-7885]|uniref:VOC family protein n=1 Tax=Actinotalea sp. JY-7885 TaxID=2758576 RepID=UPI00165D7B70|nr:VOC family protein [Actinotalea sp. JY-7885]